MKALQFLSRKLYNSVLSTPTRFYSIKAASLNHDLERLEVEFGDGAKLEYPYLFLQDNCTCPSCYHASSQSRLRKLTELSLGNPIVSAVPLTSSSDKSAKVHCKWQDGHESTFDEPWLRERRFTNDNYVVRKTNPRHQPKFISVQNGPKYFQTCDFDQVMDKPENLLGVLKTVASKGAFLIQNSKREPGQVKKLADKIGFVRLTHYGSEFTVKSEPNAVNLAYTAANLNLHTDLPYYGYPPGVQMLHCIKQFPGSGGESLLVDGFKVARHMEKEFPDEYKILCETLLEFYDVGKDYTDFFKVNHSPTFVLDKESKQVTRICYNNMVLSSYLPVHLENVRPLYGALKLFTDLCYYKENLMEFKLNEGDILVFDNWRMLHGRRAYDESKNERHLQGCYLDWDEAFSRIRVLESNMSSF